MATQEEDGAALRQAYLETVEHLAGRSRKLLRSRNARGQSLPLQTLKSDLVICVDGAEVYRKNMGTGRVKVQRFVPEQARKLWMALAQPGALIGEVMVAHEGQPLYTNIDGWIETDALSITRISERVPSQQPLQSIEAQFTPAKQGSATFFYTVPGSQDRDARSTSGTVNLHSLLPNAWMTMAGTLWARVLLLAMGALGTGIIFVPSYVDELGVRVERERLETHLREEEGRQAAKEVRHAEARSQERKPLETELVRSSAVSINEAKLLVEELYRRLSVKEYDRAIALYGPPLQGKSVPAFFNRFTKVTVENLQPVSTTDDSIDFQGENTYFYPDGSTQREARSYTVRNVDGQLKIVASEFIEAIEPR